MKRIRHYFLVLPTQCCFFSDTDNPHPRDNRTNSHFFSSQSTTKKTFSSPSFEQETLSRAPRLILEVKDSPSVPVGRVFQIASSGMKESSRAAIDGKTLIGSDKSACDIVLERDADIGEQHCVIEFNLKEKTFYLKDLGDGNGTFIKIEDSHVLRNGDVLNFGDSHARVMIQEKATDSTLTLQFYEGPLAEQEVAFRSSQQPVKIGRTKTCLLPIDDSKLSINHCFLSYSTLAGWSITDGDGNKRSANGTW